MQIDLSRLAAHLADKPVPQLSDVLDALIEVVDENLKGAATKGVSGLTVHFAEIAAQAIVSAANKARAMEAKWPKPGTDGGVRPAVNG